MLSKRIFVRIAAVVCVAVAMYVTAAVIPVSAASAGAKPVGFVDKATNRTFVPIRFLSERLGASVQWEPVGQKIAIRDEQTDIRIAVGQTVGTVNGESIELEAVPFTEGGTAYVPLRFVTGVLGVRTIWDGSTSTVLLTVNGKTVKVPVIDRGIRLDRLAPFTLTAKKFSVGGQTIEANMLVISLLHPSVDLDIALANNKLNSVEPLAGIAKRAKAKAAINGTFFDAYTKSDVKVPYGYIVSSGQMLLKSSGDRRSIVMFDRNNNAELIAGGDFAKRFAQGDMEGALQVGPRLLTNGKVTLGAKEEGFRDPKILINGGARSALGLTRDHKLILLTVRGATIPQLANVMLKSGAYQAMNLDGGASSGLYYNGKYITQPGRNISNALLVYGD
jgi:hypothetical protein